MFYLDLDEIDKLKKASWLLGQGFGRAYQFKEKDHILSHGATAKASVMAYVKERGLKEPVAKVQLLTSLRTFGYIFNPVSFYFCFDAKDRPLCVVPEIGNTFGELKYFFLGTDKLKEQAFSDQQTKYYYISPFFDLDNVLDFRIQVPDERLHILIDTMKDGEKIFYSSMVGKRQELNHQNLMSATLKYPWVTLKVIFLIHWHAAILHFFKKVPHHPKEENPQLQREVWREWQKT
jgi:DUF1365 family protein